MNLVKLLQDLLGLSTLPEIIFLIILLVILYMIVIYVVLKIEQKYLGLDQGDVPVLPDSIVSSTPLTDKFIETNENLKLSMLSLEDRFIKLRETMRNRQPGKILIKIRQSQINTILKDTNIDEGRMCHICRRQISSEEEYGFYQCCHEISHLAHIKIWHQISPTCPFCRQYTIFNHIIKNETSN